VAHAILRFREFSSAGPMEGKRITVKRNGGFLAGVEADW
jgi:hypothetical protein